LTNGKKMRGGDKEFSKLDTLHTSCGGWEVKLDMLSL